jgi:glycosyltransferase involved in cell wall biosynthesis
MDQVGGSGGSVCSAESLGGQAAGACAAPTVSVIVPAYNAAWCIERTLRSVQAQIFTDFEALIVDDGSLDDTAERVAATVQGDPRFRLIRQANGGVGAARNRGLAEARGRYLANLDSDDMWTPDFLAEAVASLDRAGETATMAFARSFWIDRHDASLAPPPEPLARPVDYREILLYNPIGNGSSALMRRDAVVACAGWDARLPRDFGPTEDWLLQLQLAARGAVVVIDKPLVYYRITETSASCSLERSARAALEVVRRLQLSEPRLPRLDYWRARSLAMLWLLRRAKRTNRYSLMIWLATHAYLRNPVWFVDRELREPMVSALRKAVVKVAGPRGRKTDAISPVLKSSTQAGTVAVTPES